MAGVNKVIIVGNLGNDPEVRYAANGSAIANISIATSESWTDKNSGDKQEKTEWHRVVMFNRLGEIAGEYLRKGSKVYVEGKLQTRKWQDNSGQDRYTTEIVASTMQMLDGRGDNAGQGGGGYQQRAPSQAAPQQGGGQQYGGGQPQYGGAKPQSAPQKPAAQPAPANDFDDDIPF